MMTLLIEYPHNVDIKAYEIPIPDSISTKESLIFTFTTKGMYWCYVKQICDLVDCLEYSRFFKYNQVDFSKIEVSKCYLVS